MRNGAHLDGPAANRGQRFEPLNHKVVKCRQILLLLGEAGASHIHVHGENMLAIHARVDAADVAQGLRKERGSTKQQEREAHLTGQKQIRPPSPRFILAG